MNIGSNYFSDNIEKVIKNASRIALRFGSDVVGTEHILYGIVSVKDCLASKVLADEGVTEEDLFEKKRFFQQVLWNFHQELRICLEWLNKSQWNTTIVF